MLVNNMIWMSWNIFLASVGLYVARLIKKYHKNKKIKWILLLPWILFIPNSIYIITDIIHLIIQWPLGGSWVRLGLFVQYLLLLSIGPVIYYYSLKYAEEAFHLKKMAGRWYYLLLFGLNILISLGVFMGRVQRTNSWNVISSPGVVITDLLATLSSLPLMLVVLLFGLFISVFYLQIQNLIRYLDKLKQKVESGRSKRRGVTIKARLGNLAS